MLADEGGQIAEAHSVSAGLDYPGVGPEHAHLRDIGRVRYEAVTDDQALAAFRELARLEGIIPALEPSHAVAWLLDDGTRRRTGPATNQGPATSSTSPAGVRGSGEGSAGYDLLTLSGRGTRTWPRWSHDWPMTERTTGDPVASERESEQATGDASIAAAFAAARERGRAAVMPYMMGGFPTRAPRSRSPTPTPMPGRTWSSSGSPTRTRSRTAR